MGTTMRILGHLLVILTLLASAALLFGPRTPFDDDPQAVAPPEAAELDGWLAAREAGAADLRPGAAKEIVWADPARPAPTELAVVYIHGFSATKAEIRPVPDIVARELGANLHYARLTGHGRTSDAMGEVTVGAWFDDVAEALAVGRRIGGRLLVIAASTGGTMAALAALDPELSRGVAAIALVSPNFGVQSAGSGLLTLPFAQSLVPLVVEATGGTAATPPGGDPAKIYLGGQASSPAQARAWTTIYPLEAVYPMAAVVKAAAASDFSGVAIPALFMFSPSDKVVDAAATRAVAAGWGGPVEIAEVTPGPGDDPNAHVIAGDIRSPSMTRPAAERIVSWARHALASGGS
jgi:alpha-beta hydrolase superfamily lysophospholipase